MAASHVYSKIYQVTSWMGTYIWR